MDRIKAKMESLRLEADKHAERADLGEVKIKQLEQALLEREQEITSLNHKLNVLEGESETRDNELRAAKEGNLAGASSSKDVENLQRKIVLLEDELDQAEKHLKETMEKLRQVDVKAEHFERQVTKLEQEVASWEAKYEEEKQKRIALQKEMSELEASLGGL